MSNFDAIFSSVELENNSNRTCENDVSFCIIRQVLSMLNGLNVETVKKNPNDIFMLLKYRNDDIQLDDECCQLIIRIGGLGKILLKIINYLNYYNESRQDSLFAYPIFDDDVETKTLGNIKQYFINSIRNEVKEYHYDLLKIEGKFRSLNVHYSYALRRIQLWSTQWLEKFLAISDVLEHCLDSKGVVLLNNIYNFSRNGHPVINKMSRSILHQALKPFVFNMFDWLLYGEISPDIDQDFFIMVKESSFEDVTQCLPVEDEDSTESIEWKLYELNTSMLPTFMSKFQIKKIFFIGNAVRLLRFMVKDEYDQKTVYDMFRSSQIQISYDIMKKFLYKNFETYDTEKKFFFEHNLVDDFDSLLNSYYEVINEEMFKILNLNEIKNQFQVLMSFVLLHRGDFYESLIDYLLPLLRKPASEVVNIVNGSCTNLHRIFNMFMVNAKLIELNQVYKIDSLLYNNFELNENLVFTFTKNILKHHLGWDIFVVRYKFTKKVYRIMFDSKSLRYEKLFRQLFHYKRVLFSIRQTQHQITYFHFIFKSFKRRQSKTNGFFESKSWKSVNQMLNTLHFIFFHMFGFSSKMYQYFGNQVWSFWSTMFQLEFKQKQKNIEKFLRSHEKFLSSVEATVFFQQDLPLLTAYSALNDSIIDFCESFCEDDLFDTMNKIVNHIDNNDNHLTDKEIYSDELFRHQFKISINISKYRCCISNFIELTQHRNLEFKFDILYYQPCLDELFRCHNRSKFLTKQNT